MKYRLEFVRMFFGNKADGRDLKISKRGCGKGPMIRPFEISSFIFAETTSGFNKAVGKLFEKRGDLGPE